MKPSILIVLTATTLLLGQETVLELNPAQSYVEFTLSDVLHAVQGSFELKRGIVHYDFATGKCSGQIVIDAQSGDSGSQARDKKMHHNILESDRYPEIVFTPDHVEGTSSKASIHGLFRIHGKDHEMTMVVEAIPSSQGRDVTAHFVIPYVEWGMKNRSVLFLRVGDQVNINVQARGRVQPGT